MGWPRWGRKARIHREASAWVIRMRGPEGRGLQDDLEAWRAISPEHDQAYRETAWLMQMAAGAERIPATTPRAVSRTDRRSGLRLGVPAAALAGAAAAGALYYEQHRDPKTVAPSEYASTATVRQATLPDGSVLTLDPGSMVLTRYDNRVRNLELIGGAAKFEVAHDADHPFIVTAGDRRVTARGTVFQVSLTRGTVSVVMLEGVVEVTHASAPSLPPVRLIRGQRLVTSGAEDRVSLAPSVAASSKLRQSVAALPLARAQAAGNSAPMIKTYDATPLAAVLADANRGAAKPIRLGALGLANLHVEGRFETGDTRSLAHILAAALDLRVEDDGKSWVLTRA